MEEILNILDKTSVFIDKAKLVHGDKYNYSKIAYINAKTKIDIMCPNHDVFNQTPDSHLRGRGCPMCANNQKTTIIDFINKGNIIHKEKYDYTLVNYINARVNIEIICPEHGIFKQVPQHHLKGIGCPKCGSIKTSDKQRSNNHDFIIKAKKLHLNKYDYSLVDYITNHTKIKIICLKHGIFEQRPNDHLNEYGCPLCSESKGETKIRKYLIDNNILFIKQKRFNDCKNKNPLPFDFYLPSNNLCIEYNGVQHYRPVECFGGEKYFKIQRKNDNIKLKYCKDNNIVLEIIKYNDDIISKLNKIA